MGISLGIYKSICTNLLVDTTEEIQLLSIDQLYMHLLMQIRAFSNRFDKILLASLAQDTQTKPIFLDSYKYLR